MQLTPGAVRSLLAAHGCHPSRALGQHFLADPNLAGKIVRLAEVGPGLLTWGDPTVAGLVGLVSSADLLVVASPTYKATFTGLLKLFLDQLPPNALQGVIAVPVVVSAAPAHGLVGEAYLRPLLVELGATVPTRAFAVTEAQLPDLDDVVQGWWAGASAPLLRSVRVVAGS